MVENLDLDNAWKQSTGEDVKIALLDSGVAAIPPLMHVHRYTADGAPYQGRILDYTGHGTRTASILGARKDNDQNRRGRLLGVAHSATLMSYCVTSHSGGYQPRLVASAMRAAAAAGADLICCPFDLRSLSDDFEATLQSMVEAKIPVIASAGNAPDSRARFPADGQPVIRVGASDQNDRVILRHKWNSKIPLSAPGERIRTWSRIYELTDDFGGTSGSAPFATGVAALGISVARRKDATGQLALSLRQHLVEILRSTSKRQETLRRVAPVEFLAAVDRMCPLPTAED